MIPNEPTLDQLKFLYGQCGGLREVAERTGLSVSTVRRRLLDGGLILKPGRPAVSVPWKATWFGEAYRWFSAHKGERMPNSTASIVKLSGLEKAKVDYFLRKRLQTAREYLKSLPQLNELDLVLKAEFGSRVPTKYITSLQLTVERFNLDVTVEVLAYGQHHHTLRFTWPQYLATVGGNTAMTKAAVPGTAS